MKIFQLTRIRVLGLALLAGTALTIPASADPADVAAITAANVANVGAQVTTTTASQIRLPPCSYQLRC